MMPLPCAINSSQMIRHTTQEAQDIDKTFSGGSRRQAKMRNMEKYAAQLPEIKHQAKCSRYAVTRRDTGA